MRKTMWALVIGGTALLLVLAQLAPSDPEPAPSVRPSPYPHAWEVTPR